MAFQVDNPLWLLAFIPMVYVLFLFSRKNMNLFGSRKVILLILRSIIFSFVILALAGVQILIPIQHMTTVFVADRSHSMMDHESTIIKSINESVKQKQLDDKVGVISIGSHATVDSPLTERMSGISEFQTDINKSFTNIGAGLQLASSLFSGNSKGRIVLLSDGNENIGDAVNQATYLKKRGYTVDVLPYDTVYQADVAIDSFEVPETIYLGEQAKLSMTINSNIESTSQIRIKEDGKLIVDQAIEIKEGTNQLSFQQLVVEDGFHTYTAEIIANGDEVVENNQLSAFAETRGLPHVLIVEGKKGAANNLQQSLQSSALNVKTIEPALLPGQLSNYLKYDTIIFSDVSATSVSGEQMDMIQTAVRDFGLGFIMTGGDQSFGVGGYYKTPIEKLLPVDTDIKGKKELPSLGLVIVMDKSGSMMGNKIALAREAAARSIDLLREKDTLGVIAFDSVPWQVVETGPITDKEAVMDKVRSITASGGTDIFTPTGQAYDQLEQLELKRKHIILLTDGQSGTTLDYQEMIKHGKEEGITLSTVAIGIEADGVLLEEMATLGDGRFYLVQNDSSIPTILSRETALITRTYIEDNPFFPKLVNGYEWTDYFSEGVPEMNAYIATTPKKRAQVMLVSEKDDPVLARWQYGLGKTVAWTSDLSGKWAGTWPTWESWSPLWNDVVTWTFPQYESEPYQLNQTLEGNQVKLNVTSPDQGLSKLNASLVNEKGSTVDLQLQQKAPGEFEGVFTSEEPGVYFLQLTETEQDKVVGSFKTGLVVPYSQEYTFQPTNKELLRQIAEAGGGTVLSDLDHAFSERGIEPHYEKQDVFFWLLVASLLLFLLDVAVRRFRIDFSFIRHRGNSRKAKTEMKKGKEKERSSQLSQLKQATKKGSYRKVESRTSNQEQRRTVEPVIVKKQYDRLKVEQKDKPKLENDTKGHKSESKEDRFARLLDAKKRK
ncbi:VWA domain-containing protein [Aquibacillus kalidii]|uniref:VWA domain-containing protein n=1 Tax=Aquibacillus kalidii TaxID=2762597 RepID=UPI0016472CD8|nr:VWA domain-containing protein [Aquibacillus kalidii]